MKNLLVELFVIPRKARRTNKFFNSTSEDELSNIPYSVPPRGQTTMTYGDFLSCFLFPFPAFLAELSSTGSEVAVDRHQLEGNPIEKRLDQSSHCSPYPETRLR
eukprot:gene8429-9291_t